MEYKRITKRIISQNCEEIRIIDADTSSIFAVYKRLAELEDKIENGTLIELPCKVGDDALDANEVCPICGYPLHPSDNQCGCQCYFAGSAHPDRSIRESIVYEHLYLLSPEQVKHIINLQSKKQISYCDEKKNQILKELKGE